MGFGPTLKIIADFSNGLNYGTNFIQLNLSYVDFASFENNVFNIGRKKINIFNFIVSV